MLLYGYARGIHSSRKLARACVEDVAFRVLAAGNEPDHRTVSDFRKRHLAALSGLFVQVLRLCREAELVTLDHVAIDGTKIKANASKHKAMSYDPHAARRGAAGGSAWPRPGRAPTPRRAPP